MELLKVSLGQRLKQLIYKIDADNLFLLSSSVSYYSALGLAPFLLIILWVASLLGSNVQADIVERTATSFSPYVAELISMVFKNVNKGINIGTISGAIGFIVLLWTCSLVFIQFRYAFDVIYGYYNPNKVRTAKTIILERLLAMLTVLLSALLLFVSFTLMAVFEYIFGSGVDTKALVIGVNFILYVIIFTNVHYFVPTKRPKVKNAFLIAIVSSLFFIIGNILLASYLKGFAASSVYGAAGTLLVFLIWSYYSAFTLFLSVEFFQFLKKAHKGNKADLLTRISNKLHIS